LALQFWAETEGPGVSKKKLLEADRFDRESRRDGGKGDRILLLLFRHDILLFLDLLYLRLCIPLDCCLGSRLYLDQAVEDGIYRCLDGFRVEEGKEIWSDDVDTEGKESEFGAVWQVVERLES
jgi:hypothetical protein